MGTGRGTHKGEFQGIAPTGKHMTVPGFVMYRIVSGKITAFHGLLDGMAMLQQLGGLCTPLNKCAPNLGKSAVP